MQESLGHGVGGKEIEKRGCAKHAPYLARPGEKAVWLQVGVEQCRRLAAGCPMVLGESRERKARYRMGAFRVSILRCRKRMTLKFRQCGMRRRAAGVSGWVRAGFSNRSSAARPRPPSPGVRGTRDERKERHLPQAKNGRGVVGCQHEHTTYRPPAEGGDRWFLRRVWVRRCLPARLPCGSCFLDVAFSEWDGHSSERHCTCVARGAIQKGAVSPPIASTIGPKTTARDDSRQRA